MFLPGLSQGIVENRKLMRKTHRPGDILAALDIQVTGIIARFGGGIHSDVGTAFSSSGTFVPGQNYGFWTSIIVHDIFSTSKDIGNVGLEMVVNQNVDNGSPLFGYRSVPRPRERQRRLYCRLHADEDQRCGLSDAVVQQYLSHSIVDQQCLTSTDQPLEFQ